MKLKTLKDIDSIKRNGMVDEVDLRQEAIKWVKEDIEEFSYSDDEEYRSDKLINKWMRRLDITEEDLK